MGLSKWSKDMIEKTLLTLSAAILVACLAYQIVGTLRLLTTLEIGLK